VVATDAPSSKPRLLKLGVKPGQRVSVVGVADPALLDELRRHGADVSARMRRDSDLIFFGARQHEDLERIREVKDYIRKDGAIWVVRAKGKDRAITETDVIRAGLAAGLVDNKIVSFSDTHGAMRLVYRIRDRG
jgi:hypothetical protein